MIVVRVEDAVGAGVVQTRMQERERIERIERRVTNGDTERERDERDERDKRGCDMNVREERQT